MADGTSKKVRDLLKGDAVWGGPGAVTAPRVRAVVEILEPAEKPEGYCEPKPGFLISGDHPIIGSQERWIRPKWEYPAKPVTLPSVFSLILEDAHAVYIQGLAVATLVPEPVGVPLIDQPHKLGWYEQISRYPGFEKGYVSVKGGLKGYNYTEMGWTERDWDALYLADALP
jgi:hypothetical protein